MENELSGLDIINKPSLATSRRSFILGSRLAVAASLGFGLSLLPQAAFANRKPKRGGDDDDCDDRDPSPHHCFLEGTRISTARGETDIQSLSVGDLVFTASGSLLPVKWIARRTVSRNAHRRWDASVAPVKISRFAIDGKAPHTDLYVSPAHGLFIDGMIVPAHVLVNGVTVIADAIPEAVELTYYHVELERHEAILAEGLAVESFAGHDRGAFDNADEYVALYGSLGEVLKPFAPVASYNGGRQELASHVRSALAPIYDVRKPIDKVRDRVAYTAIVKRAA